MIPTERIDTIVVGAGPSGLCAAKTLLQYDRHADVVLLDARAGLGGVWARERLYPTLKTNNLRGGVDFTDLALDEARFGVKEGEHVPGQAMHAYLSVYADRFGVADKIRFGCTVVEVRRGGGSRRATKEAEGGGGGGGERGDDYDRDDGEEGWTVEVEQQPAAGRGAGAARRQVLECNKLIVATGILSAPHLPTLPGADAFRASGAALLHSSEFGTPQTTPAVHDDPRAQNITVLGGGKSAYDAVYLAATTNRRRRVDWVIRKSGRGPAWVFPPHTYLGPFRAWKERLPVRRIFSFMSPWPFPDRSGWGWLRRFLHAHPLGRRLSDAFLRAIHHDTIRDVGYETDPRFKVLQPEANPFWYGTQSGTLSFDTDFFDLIRSGQVKVHREDITRLSARTVHLGNGKALPADALVAATGFASTPTIAFSLAPGRSRSALDAAELGLPTPSGALARHQQAAWAKLDGEADRALAAQFPRLLPDAVVPPGSPYAKTPTTHDASYTITPWRLYRGIAPPGLATRGDRSLVFLGMFSNITNTTRLELQCLWALAYLTGDLDRRGAVPAGAHAKDVLRETALWQRYTQHRAPYGHGKSYPDLVFDQVPYWDMLLHDLGLETRRKGGWRELFMPYTYEDYRGVVDEWIRKTRQ